MFHGNVAQKHCKKMMNKDHAQECSTGMFREKILQDIRRNIPADIVMRGKNVVKRL
jgi:hypothetical protein